MLINLLLVVLIVVRLWTAGVLFITARQNKLTNLYWLAGGFVLFDFGAAFVSTAGNPLASLPVSLWLVPVPIILWQFTAIQFVQGTFYRGRPSPAPWMWGAAVVLSAVTLYGLTLSASNYEQHPLVAGGSLLVCLVSGWQAWAGYQAWRRVAHEKTVEDWVKGRYLLVVGYSLLQLVDGFSAVIRIVVLGGGTAGALGIVLALSQLIANLGVVVLSYLAWAAPAGYYTWLNRNYTPVEVKELSEEEVMRHMLGG